MTSLQNNENFRDSNVNALLSSDNMRSVHDNTLRSSKRIALRQQEHNVTHQKFTSALDCPLYFEGDKAKPSLSPVPGF